MPPDITTGPLALGASPGISPGVSISVSGAGPPGSDPLAALFASLLARGGSPVPTDTPFSKLGAKTPTLLPPGGKLTDPRKDKTTEDKAMASLSTVAAPSAAAIPLLLLPLPIQSQPNQSQPNQNQTDMTRPTTPPIAEGTAGPKTMDTFPATVTPPQGATVKTPDGELPLQDARNDRSNVSAQFPNRLVTSSLPPAASPSLGSLPPPASVLSPALARQAPQTGELTAVEASAFNAPVPTADTVLAALTPGQVNTPQTPVTLPGNRSVPMPAARTLPDVLRPVGSLSVSASDLPVAVRDADRASSAAVKAAAAGQAITPGDSVETPASRTLEPHSPETQSLLLKTGTKPQSGILAQSGILGAAPAPIAADAVDAAPVRTLDSGAVDKGVLPITDSISSVSASPSESGSANAAFSSAPSPGTGPTPGTAVTAENSLPALSHMLAQPAAGAWKGAAPVTGAAATSSEAGVPLPVQTTAAETANRTAPAGGEQKPEIGLKLPALPADTTTITRVQTVPTKPSGRTKTDLAGFEPALGGKRAERRTEEINTDATDGNASTMAAASAPLETAQAEAKTLTAPDRAEIIRQITEGMDALPLPAKAGASEQMTLQLHPKDWGQLQISVTLQPGARPEDSQTVTAHIVAASPQVKAALESGSGDLRHALHEAGLHLDRITVTVQSASAEATPGGGHRGSEHGMSGGASHQASPDQKTGMSDAGRLETRTFEARMLETGKSETGMSSGQGSGTGTFAAFAGSHGGRQGGQPQAPVYFSREAEEVSEAESPRRPAAGKFDTRA